MNNIEPELLKYIKKIVRLFYYDTIELLDDVLSDDSDDPEYSANAVYKRLQLVRSFHGLFYHCDVPSLDTILEQGGYKLDDILRFHKKCEAEKKRLIVK